MALERKIVGKPEKYRGRTITIRYMGPDLLCEVDGIELSGFFVDVEAARSGGQRYVDAEIKAEEEAAAKAQRVRA